MTTTMTAMAPPIPPRVIIKAAVHVFEANNTSTMTMILHIILHRIVFFAIKSLRNVYEKSSTTVEGSSSSTSSSRGLLMLLDNTMRTLNKVHTLLPLLVVVVPLLSILVLGPIQCPLQMLPYITYVLLICVWRLSSPFQIKFLRSIAICIAITRTIFVQDLLSPKTIILHLLWLGMCCYMEINAEMIRNILFAPIPNRIELNLDDDDDDDAM